MPLKTHKKHATKKHPKHYAKVYWPYIPLLVVMGIGLLLGNSSVGRSQRGVLAYSTSISAQALLSETNEERVAYTQKSLTLNQKLMDAAQAKAEDMAERDYWSHNTPDGQSPWVFIDGTGYEYQKAGENLAYGFGTSEETIVGWMNSEAHKENILDPLYQEVGFGIVNTPNYQRSGPATIVVAMYGYPLGAVEPLASVSDSNVPIATSKKALTTETPNQNEPAVQSINKAQALTGGKMPWIPFALGLLGGAALVYLLIKHSLALRRKIQNGEKFLRNHPAFDATILVIIIICLLLNQSVGFIR